MTRRCGRWATGVALGLGIAALAARTEAQPQRPLTIDVIYDPASSINFSGSPTTDVTWIDATSYMQARPSAGGGSEWVRVDAASGAATPIFDAARMEGALAAVPGVPADAARAAARSRSLIINPTRTAAATSIGGDLYLYEFGAARAVRLTTAAGDEEEGTFSPDGRLLAFVRANNLFVVDTATQVERALTDDGGAEILNGKLDWLYQEEIYGRGRFRGYWWSPDSARLAFLQLDERPAPEYTVVDHIPYRPALEVTDYPKAGDPNPKVRLGVAAVSGGTPLWMDTSGYGGDFLIVNVDWTPDSEGVVHHVQDREQTWLDLAIAEATTGKARRLLRETTKAWVNENGPPVWLRDGSFLWLSERSGYQARLPLQARRQPGQPGHQRALGGPEFLRHRREQRQAVFLLGGTLPDRRRHLPRAARRPRIDAALDDRGDAPRDLQSDLHALRRRLE